MGQGDRGGDAGRAGRAAQGDDRSIPSATRFRSTAASGGRRCSRPTTTPSPALSELTGALRRSMFPARRRPGPARVSSKEFAETERGLITNARCLTEGVDVPDIDCVLFADPRRSAVDIVQAVGRALRPAAGKKMGYVIVPILHDADAKPEDIFESDGLPGDSHHAPRAGRQRRPHHRVFPGDLPRASAAPAAGASSSIWTSDWPSASTSRSSSRDIELKCWDRLAKLSWRPFEEARDFVHQLKLKSRAEWVAFCKGKMPYKGRLPADIPADS